MLGACQRVGSELGASGWARLRAGDRWGGAENLWGQWEEESEWRAMEEGLGVGGPRRRGSELQARGIVSPEADWLSSRQSGPPLQHCREPGPGLEACR